MPVAENMVGRAVGNRYRLEDVLGDGTFARVYLATDLELQRRVAVKVVHPWWAQDPEWARRNRAEARAIARINHPGVVQVHDFGNDEIGPYVVTEVVTGETLKARLARGPVAVRWALELSALVAEALGAAHERGVIHRDIKPANILLSRTGAVKVADFGIARITDATNAGSTMTRMAGTPTYASPEQARGQGVTYASDLYSLGVVAYEMLAGRPPFTSDAAGELVLAHVQQKPPSLADLANVPQSVADPIERALRKNPEQRFSSGREMARALRAAAHGLRHGCEGAPPRRGTTLREGSTPRPPRARTRRTRPTVIDRRRPPGVGNGPHGAPLPPPVRGRPAPERPQSKARVRAKPAKPTAAEAAAAEPYRITAFRSETADQHQQQPALSPPPPSWPAQPGRSANAGGPQRPAPRQLTEPLPPRRRRGLFGAIAAIVVLALAGSIAYAAVAAGEEDVVVPKLKGLDRSHARAVAKDRSLRIQFDSVYSEKPKGEVIGQIPRAGKTTAAGNTIVARVSAGPRPVPVADVVGMQVQQARAELEAQKLKVETRTEQTDQADPGTVLAQGPNAGAEVKRGTTVTLVVAAMPPEPPNLFDYLFG